MKKKLNVYVVGNNKNYANFLTCEFQLVSKISDSDIVLFTGGEDVNPSFYEDNVGSKTVYNSNRDKEEYQEFQMAVRFKKLIIGICRGSQFLTVMSGGSLIQHVSNHAGGQHAITIIGENRNINITSTHHQMMYPFKMNRNHFTIIAKAASKISKTFLSGNDREMKLPLDFVECEIVYYNKTNCLCIQGHPEYMDHESDAVVFINVLVEELLEDNVPPMTEEQVNQILHEEEIRRNPRNGNPFDIANGIIRVPTRMERAVNVDVLAHRHGHINPLQNIGEQRWFDIDENVERIEDNEMPIDNDLPDGLADQIRIDNMIRANHGIFIHGVPII